MNNSVYLEIQQPVFKYNKNTAIWKLCSENFQVHHRRGANPVENQHQSERTETGEMQKKRQVTTMFAEDMGRVLVMRTIRIPRLKLSD